MKPPIFNRLWIRFSVVISIVILMAVMLVFVLGFLLRPDTDVRFADLPAETQEILSNVLATFTRSVALFVIAGAVLGILASIWASRRLTKPLEELATGAQAIGSRNLDYRVPISGTYEMQTLADSFNTMASELAESEQLRRSLLADVAHELRTPLTVLEGSLRAILDDVYKLDKIEVARLYDQTRQLRHMVNDLHELAQAEANQLPLERQTHNAVELVENAAKMFEPLAEAHEVQLLTDLPSQPLPIYADHARIIQVLQNLLNNALRHTPAGGSITLRVSASTDSSRHSTTENHTVENHTVENHTVENNMVAIDVQDSGSGIAPDHLPRVFDRFYRLDEARDRDAGGAGLGLAIVRALIEAHEGSVAVESPGLGSGSTFTVLLPRR